MKNELSNKAAQAVEALHSLNKFYREELAKLPPHIVMVNGTRLYTDAQHEIATRAAWKLANA